MSKKKIARQVLNYFLVIIGTALLAFGSVIFLTKLELVAGGISGIAIIVQHFVSVPIYDYLAAALTAFFWIVGLIFVGKDFAMKTLLSSVLYIGFTFLFKRVDFFDRLAAESAGLLTESGEASIPTMGNFILCALFGGVFIGGGVALTFLGGGSTGGVDVIQVLMNKYLRIKESISGFMIDAIVILAGMISMRMWTAALCGILSSFLAAVFIELVYIKNQSSFQVDIISSKWKEISNYAQKDLERGATIVHAEGGYKGDERIILRVIIHKNQYELLRDYIAGIDPQAFVTFTQTNAVFGEGFVKNRKSLKKRKK